MTPRAPGEVVLRFRQPAPLVVAWLARLPILPAHGFAAGDLRPQPGSRAPVGTGPFRFVEWRSGEAIVLGPPTLDYAASQKLVAPIDTGTLAGGTAIGTGLATGINVLRGSEAKSKVVILLTDGENNSGDITPLDAANMAKLLGVRVYTIGAVSVTTTADKDVSTDSVDAQLMRKIAEDTGGHYYSVSDENSLAEVYREIESLEKSHVGARDFVDYQEAHLGFLALGVALLFAELALAATVFRRTP